MLTKNSQHRRKRNSNRLKNIGEIDPLNIEDYIARDGYMALGKVLTEMTQKIQFKRLAIPACVVVVALVFPLV